MAVGKTRLGFWARNAPLWFVGAFVLFFGTQIVLFSVADRDAQDGIDAYNRGAYPQAEGWLRRATRLDPQHGRAEYYLGLCLVRDGRRGEARGDFETALAVGTGNKLMRRDDDLVQEAQAQLDQLNRSQGGL